MDTPDKHSADQTSSDPFDECKSAREEYLAELVPEVPVQACAQASSAGLVAETTANAPLLENSSPLTTSVCLVNFETEPKPTLVMSTDEEQAGTEAPSQSEGNPCDEINSDFGSDGYPSDYGPGDDSNEGDDNSNEDNNITDDDDAWNQIWDQVGAAEDVPLLAYPFSTSQHHPLPVEILFLMKKYVHSRADLLHLMLTCKMTVSVLCKYIWEHPEIPSLKAFKLLWRTAVESRVYQSLPFFNMIHTIKIDTSVPIGDDELFDVLERCHNLQVLDVSGNQNISSTSISQVSSSCPKLRELILARCGRVEMKVLSSRLESNNGWGSVVISPEVLVVIDFSETRLSDDVSCLCLQFSCLSVYVPCWHPPVCIFYQQDVERITSHFSFLEEINFSKCPSLTNASLLHIAHNCAALSKLVMSKTRVSDDGIEALCFHSRQGRSTSPRHTLAHVECNSTGVSRHAIETLFKNCNALKHVELLSCVWLQQSRDVSCDKEAIFRDKVAFQKLQLRLAAESGEDYPRNPDFANQFPLKSLSIHGNEAMFDTLHILIERSPYLQQLNLQISNGNCALMELIARSDSIEHLSINIMKFSKTVSAILSQTQLKKNLKHLTHTVSSDPNPMRSLFRLAQSCPNLCSVQFNGSEIDTEALEPLQGASMNSFEVTYGIGELMKMRQFGGDFNRMGEDELNGILEHVAA
ncbi:hypothetical protein BJ741DRAFT_625512 [Chytriomyces cf. hyalinus JEL632]|nr:hypothetical protein BJ741DRAFT_625512 [Chytriomyces cf. hyalinus JEL632]